MKRFKKASDIDNVDIYNEVLDLSKTLKHIEYVDLIETAEDFKCTQISSITTKYREYIHANLSACGKFVVVADQAQGSIRVMVYFIPIDLANKYPTIFDSIYVSIH